MNNLSLSFLGGPEVTQQANIPPQNPSTTDPKLLTKDKKPPKGLYVNKLRNMKDSKKFEIDDGLTVKEIVKKVIEEKPSLNKLRDVFRKLVKHYEEDSDDEF